MDVGLTHSYLFNLEDKLWSHCRVAWLELVLQVSFCQQNVLVIIPHSSFPLGLAACHLPSGAACAITST